MRHTGHDTRWMWWSAITVLAVALTVWNPVGQGDPWFHLTHGRDHTAAGITPLTDTLPLTETYSWTAPGTSWQSSGWLFGLLTYQLQQVGGLTVVTLLPSLTVLCGAGAVGWLVYRRNRTMSTAAIAAAASACMFTFGAGVRPQLVTYLLTVPFAACVAEAVNGPTWTRRTGAATTVAALTVLWVNLHSGGLSAPLLAGAVTIGAGIDAHTRTRTGTARTGIPSPVQTIAYGVAVVAMCAAATLLNPYGTNMWTHAATVRKVSWPLNEWQSAWDRPMLAVLVVGPVVAALLVTVARAVRTRTGWTVIVPAVLWTGLTLDALRHIVQLGLLTVFAVAVTASAERTRWQRSSLMGAVTAVWITAATFNLADLPGTLHNPAPGVADGTQELPTGCKLLNDLMVGGYVLWARPDVQVSVDGRNDVYGAEPVVQQRAWLHDPDPAAGLAAVADNDIGCVLADGRSPLVDTLVARGWTRIGSELQPGAVAPAP